MPLEPRHARPTLIVASQAETDCLHLWFGRRAQIRIRSLLVASIYDKAFKRKVLSGNAHRGDWGKGIERAGDPRPSPEVGKVVNMVSGDANQIASLVSGMHSIYGAPLEIALAGLYLYKLLGWSAFSGLIVLVISWSLDRCVTSPWQTSHALNPP